MTSRAAMRRLAALGLLALTACGADKERPLQGYVEGEYVRVGAPFAGTLEKLSVQRGDQVAVGAPLFALEQENELAQRRQAQQQLQAAQARLENLKTGRRAPEVETVNEQLRQAIAARDLSAANLKRQEALFKSGFISSAALDDVRTKLRSDEAHVSELRASLATMNQTTGRPEEIRAAEGDAKAAREALAMADWKLGQRTVEAPTAGRVNDTFYVVGDFVPAG